MGIIIIKFTNIANKSTEILCVYHVKYVSCVRANKFEKEGTLSAISVIKTPRYDCCFVSPNVVNFYDLTWVSLSIFTWTRSNLDLEIKKRLNFNDFLWQAIFEIFQIWTKDAILEAISPYTSLFETFASNRPFICKHHQTIKQ